MRHSGGFLAGAAFVIGILLGTFIVAPALQDARRERPPMSAPPSETAAPQAAAPAPQTPFDIAVAAGNEAMDAEKYREAIAAYERALAIRFDADVATDRGVCFRLLGEPQRALTAFEFVTLKEPDHWKARYNRAVVLLQLGRVDEARVEAERVAAQEPNEPAVRKLLETVRAAR